jgi:preprotein translocase subunit SecG
MGFIIGLMTIALVLNCIVLIFLVLIQLPKKEAGAGLAFGGAATDALFGAGSGNVLTKVTKYAAIGFFVLALVLAVAQNHYHGRSTSKFMEGLSKPDTAATVPPSAPAKPAAAGAAATNLLRSVAAEATNTPAPAASGTNAAPAK